MSEACQFCRTPYMFSSRVNADIPTCQCLQHRASAAAIAQRQSDDQVVAEQRVLALRIGKLSAHDKLAPTIEGWEDVKAAVLAGRNLVITGPVGVRKTTVLKQIAYGAAMAGLKIRGGYVLEMLSTFKDMDRVKEYSYWLEGGQVLFLDDLDKMLGTQYEVERLLLLVDRYWAFGRSVVVSMNMTPDQFFHKVAHGRGNQEKETEALISRLIGGAQVVNLQGADLRFGSKA